MANDFYAWRRLFTLQWHNAASLRASFLANVVGMMVNNVGVTVVWVLFISLFGTVNGWGMADVIGAHGIGGLAYGVAYTFCVGAVMLPYDIRNGNVDSYFLRPLRLLPLQWRSHFDASAVGDMAFGGIMIVIACVLAGSSWTVAAIAFFLCIPAAVLMVAMSTLINSYNFWNPQDRQLSDMAYRVFITPSLFPAGAFPDALRAFFTFVVPSLLVAGIPWEVAKSHAPLLIAAVWVAAFVWMGIAVLVFRAGLRRYESGGTG